MELFVFVFRSPRTFEFPFGIDPSFSFNLANESRGNATRPCSYSSFFNPTVQQSYPHAEESPLLRPPFVPQLPKHPLDSLNELSQILAAGQSLASNEGKDECPPATELKLEM